MGDTEIRSLRCQLAERSAELQKANTELARLLEIKDRFVSLATHDIRTPVTTMKLAVAVLETSLPPDAREKVRKSLDILSRNLARVENKLQEYRLITRLDLQCLHLTIGPVDLNDAVKDAVASYFPGAISRGVTLDAEFSEVPAMRGDAARIGQLARELIESSLERLGEGERLLVQTCAEGNGAWIRIVDDGPLVPPDETEGLLRGLDTGDPTQQTRAPLFAAHQIARAHGGRIALRSSREEGTVFSAWLPFVPSIEGKE